MFEILDKTPYSLTINYFGKEMTSTTISQGCDRTVYVFADFVVKLERAGHSDSQNQCEWETFQKIEEQDIEYFAKIFDYGFTETPEDDVTYIIQERVPAESQYVDGKKVPMSLCGKLAELKWKYNLRDVFFGQTESRDYNHNVAPMGDSFKIWDLGMSGD